MDLHCAPPPTPCPSLTLHGPAAVVVLDDQRRVLRANAAALQILATRDALQLRDGCFGAIRVRDDATLQQHLRAASLHTDRRELPCMKLSRRSGARDYLLQFGNVRVQANDGERAAGDAVRGVCVVICDPAAAHDVPDGLLQRLFELTPAEALVAHHVAQGETLEDVATALGLSRNGVKYHLKNIYRKTQVRRQAQLIRLVAELTWSAARLLSPEG